MFSSHVQPPGASFPETLSRPMTAKSRQNSAAPTPRSRGDLTHVARSSGATGSGQRLLCPRKASQYSVPVRIFILAKILRTLTIGYGYCIDECVFQADRAYRVREQGCKSAISSQETPLPTPSALPAAARDMAPADVHCFFCIML